MKLMINPDKIPEAFEVKKKGSNARIATFFICFAFICINIIVMCIISHNYTLYLSIGLILIFGELILSSQFVPHIDVYIYRTVSEEGYDKGIYDIKDFYKLSEIPSEIPFSLPRAYYKGGYWGNNFSSHFIFRGILSIAIVILFTDFISDNISDSRSVIVKPLWHFLHNKPKDKIKAEKVEKKIYLKRNRMTACFADDDIVLVREYNKEGQVVDRRNYYWENKEYYENGRNSGNWEVRLRAFISKCDYLNPSVFPLSHLDSKATEIECNPTSSNSESNEILLKRIRITRPLSEIKIIQLETAKPTNWNGRFVVVPIDYFSAGAIPSFAQVLARAKRLGLEFLDEADKNVAKQVAEFRDKNSLTDKNDYWLGMKPEILDKKLAMNMVNDQLTELRCSKLDNSYLDRNRTLEYFIFKAPKDLDAKILTERLRSKAWQNKTNDNEFANWFVEPKEPPPPVEHRQSSRSSEYDGLEDWEIAEIKAGKKDKEIRQGINNAVSPVSSDLQSVKIKSPFAEDEKPTRYRRVDSTLCDAPKK